MHVFYSLANPAIGTSSRAMYLARVLRSRKSDHEDVPCLLASPQEETTIEGAYGTSTYTGTKVFWDDTITGVIGAAIY